jgi:hypothetical protein
MSDVSYEFCPLCRWYSRCIYNFYHFIRDTNKLCEILNYLRTMTARVCVVSDLSPKYTRSHKVEYPTAY